MLPFKLVYHPRYDLNLGAHVFPSQKFRLLQELLLREKIATSEDIVQPDRAADEDLLRVHTQEWVTKLKTGTLTASDVMKLEVPYSPELAEAVWLAAGGTILAGQLALRDGFASNLTGGFHHAHANHGEGFCAIHDVAIAIRRLQADGLIKKAVVVDTDVHHGNGTAHIFRNDDSVFTLSIHQEHNYPAYKPPSSLDLALDDAVEDEEYLATLLPAVEQSLDEFHPDILFKRVTKAFSVLHAVAISPWPPHSLAATPATLKTPSASTQTPSSRLRKSPANLPANRTPPTVHDSTKA